MLAGHQHIIGNNFLSRTQLVAIDILQDRSTFQPRGLCELRTGHPKFVVNSVFDCNQGGHSEHKLYGVLLMTQTEDN